MRDIPLHGVNFNDTIDYATMKSVKLPNEEDHIELGHHNDNHRDRIFRLDGYSDLENVMYKEPEMSSDDTSTFKRTKENLERLNEIENSLIAPHK